VRCASCDLSGQELQKNQYRTPTKNRIGRCANPKSSFGEHKTHLFNEGAYTCCHFLTRIVQLLFTHAFRRYTNRRMTQNGRYNKSTDLGMLCELSHDLIGQIMSFVCRHRDLCTCAQAASALRSEARRIMQSRYADESVHVERIVVKLRLEQCFTRHVARPSDDETRAWDRVRFKSVEWLKHRIGWVENVPSTGYDENDLIRDVFYCDCPKCHRTPPCGRGFTMHLNTHEASIVRGHFQVPWWDEIGE